MPINKSIVDSITPWLISELPKLTEVDIDILSQYVVATLEASYDDEDEVIKSKCIETFQEFLEENTNVFVDSLMTQIVQKRSDLANHASSVSKETDEATRVRGRNQINSILNTISSNNQPRNRPAQRTHQETTSSAEVHTTNTSIVPPVLSTTSMAADAPVRRKIEVVKRVKHDDDSHTSTAHSRDRDRDNNTGDNRVQLPSHNQQQHQQQQRYVPQSSPHPNLTRNPGYPGMPIHGMGFGMPMPMMPGMPMPVMHPSMRANNNNNNNTNNNNNDEPHNGPTEEVQRAAQLAYEQTRTQNNDDEGNHKVFFEKVPDNHLNNNHLYQYYTQLGAKPNRVIFLSHNRAIVFFAEKKDADAAVESTDAVLGNRFITVSRESKKRGRDERNTNDRNQHNERRNQQNERHQLNKSTPVTAADNDSNDQQPNDQERRNKFVANRGKPNPHARPFIPNEGGNVEQESSTETVAPAKPHIPSLAESQERLTANKKQMLLKMMNARNAMVQDLIQNKTLTPQQKLDIKNKAEAASKQITILTKEVDVATKAAEARLKIDQAHAAKKKEQEETAAANAASIASGSAPTDETPVESTD